MSTYPALTPNSLTWTEVPALTVATDLQVLNGAVWLSDDPSPTDETALKLTDEGGAYYVRANRTLYVLLASAPGCSVRRMDA